MGECVGFGLLSYFMNFGQLLGSYGNLGRRPSQTALGKNFCRSEESKELGIGFSWPGSGFKRMLRHPNS